MAYRAGDENALGWLVRRYVGPVHRFLTRMVGDARMAEDLAQETFIKAWRHLNRFDENKPFLPWLLTIAQRTAIDELRKKHALPFSILEDEALPDLGATIADTQPLPDVWLARKETAAVLEEELLRLPPRTRAILLMHETEDLTFEAIAELMKEPMNTVKSRYRRAILALKKQLTERFSTM